MFDHLFRSRQRTVDQSQPCVSLPRYYNLHRVLTGAGRVGLQSRHEKPHPRQHIITSWPRHIRNDTSSGHTRQHLLSRTHTHTHVGSQFKHTDTCTRPAAHLLSKSRKKCGQFSKSLPRTLMRFPMAGDLDGRRQQKNAYSTTDPGNPHAQTKHAHGEHSRPWLF